MAASPGRLDKAYSTFALCDEAYALAGAEQARSWPGGRILSVQFLLVTAAVTWGLRALPFAALVNLAHRVSACR